MVCSIFCFGKIGLLVNDNSKMKNTDKNIFHNFCKILKNIVKYSNTNIYMYVSMYI
jgi:hypothetical protein